MVLKELRAKKGWNQKFVADYLNIALETYNRKENGRLAFRDYEINALLELFDKTYEEVFGKNE